MRAAGGCRPCGGCGFFAARRAEASAQRAQTEEAARREQADVEASAQRAQAAETHHRMEAQRAQASKAAEKRAVA